MPTVIAIKTATNAKLNLRNTPLAKIFAIRCTLRRLALPALPALPDPKILHGRHRTAAHLVPTCHNFEVRYGL
jgi:hypothetical protein